MSQLAPLKNGPWNLTDLTQIPKNGLKVFSCFHCGGGSTMGYKLAGYEMLGGVDIDPEMMAIYRANHIPKNSYLMGVQQFNAIPDSELPKELFDLDILDGSPPCSSFSMAGSREKAWGTEKKFREGQAHQVLDDLFFHFIDTAIKLKPKVVVAENVKGLIIGNARGYVKEIFAHLDKAGYKAQLFLFNSATMGVPQATVSTPPVDEFLVPYKTWAKIRASKKEIPLTQAQHEIAHIFGFSDWQKFHYFFQQMSEVDIGLTRSEWFYLCEAHNGHMYSKSETARTMANDLCEADKYDNLGQKWFGEQSVFDLENEETYEPSDAVRAFAIRVKNFTPEQYQAAIATYHYFWGKPFPFDVQVDREGFQEMDDAFRCPKKQNWIAFNPPPMHFTPPADASL